MTPLEFLSDHTYRMVLCTTMIIGLVAGSLGSFAYLRKQSLISDVISHAALPGALLAFIVTVGVWNGDGRNMIPLLVGAVITGTLAVWLANLITRRSVIKIDTAMAVTLALFFGAGMLLVRIISDSTLPGKGGIQGYLFGNASVLTTSDLVTSAAVGVIALGTLALFWKEFALRTFDPHQATVLGFRARVIDTVMFGAVVVATVMGIKAVGLVLMVAFVVTPPAAARQWTRRLSSMVVLAGAIGAVCSAVGAYLSVLWGGIPTGPLIVLVLFVVLLLSLVFSPHRSLVSRAITRSRARARLHNELREESRQAVEQVRS